MAFNPALLASGYGGGWLWGKDDGKSKAGQARRSEDIARQGEEVRQIGNQFLAQLVPGSEEYNQLQSEIQRLYSQVESPADEQAIVRDLGQQLVSAQQSRIARGEPATPLEARTQAAFQGLRDISKRTPFEEDVFSALQGGATTTPFGQVLSRQVGRASSPTVDDDVFRNALKIVEDRVNAEAAGRGILGGGLRLEQLGRAGTEAAVAEALRQDQLRQQAYENVSGIFNVGEGLRQRDIGLEGALVDMQLGRESALTGFLNQNQNLRLDDLRNLLERTTGQATADRLDALDAEAARKAAIGQALGTGLAVGAAPFTGGASLAFAPSAGQFGGTLAGGGGSQTSSAQQYLSSRRSQPTSATPPPLSRQPGQQMNTEAFAELLRQLGTGGSSSSFASRLKSVGF